MDHLTFRLHSGPFTQIANGTKTIEARLYDEKRRTIKVGDTLRFISRENGATVQVRVISLLRSGSFLGLFNKYGTERFGGQPSEVLANRMREFYSEDDERKYGVLGIEFERLG